jgi:hypothetical protein
MLNVYDKFITPKALKDYSEKYPLVIALKKLQMAYDNADSGDLDDGEYMDIAIYESDRKILKANLNVVAKYAISATSYAIHILGGRFPEGEKAICTQTDTAYVYARDVLKRRWSEEGHPEAEAFIAKDKSMAYGYALELINKGNPNPPIRWKEAEPAIMTDPFYAFNYAEKILRGRWADVGLPEGEKSIAENDYYGYIYARDIVKGRWEEAEPAIAKDAQQAQHYAKEVLKCRWKDIGKPEVEDVIKEKAWPAFNYAAFTMKERWPEAEPIIKTSRMSWSEYTKRFNVDNA